MKIVRLKTLMKNGVKNLRIILIIIIIIKENNVFEAYWRKYNIYKINLIYFKKGKEKSIICLKFFNQI